VSTTGIFLEVPAFTVEIGLELARRYAEAEKYHWDFPGY